MALVTSKEMLTKARLYSMNIEKLNSFFLHIITTNLSVIFIFRL